MTNEGMTNAFEHRSPSSSSRWLSVRLCRSALAVGAALLATATAVRSQAQTGPPSFNWLYQHQPKIAAAAVAKAAAGQQALARGAQAALAQSAAAGTITTFDVPGAGTGYESGTTPVAINGASTITGYYATGSYADANLATHGFVRATNGTITSFDAPGDVNGTHPSSIDSQGEITGYYCDVNELCHGFTRSPDGVIVSFDPAEVAGTYPFSIGSHGLVTGYYWDTEYQGRGFVRSNDGSIATFSVPGAANGTYAFGVSAAGVSGAYVDASYQNHGFVGANGAMTTFDPPGQLGFLVDFGAYSFAPGLSINAGGTIPGYYFETISGNPFGGNWRGFVRAPDGNFTTFDAGSETICCLWTFPYSINAAGVTTGSYNDDTGLNHGFLLAVDGTITTLDAPGAGTGYIQGTVSLSINAAGQTTGFYTDSNNGHHGFLYQP